MTFDALSPSLKDFVQRVLVAADGLSLATQARPELLGTGFSGSLSSSTSLKPTDLPTEAYGLEVGRYTVMFGTLPEVPSLPAIREALRLYRNQCIVARSFMSTNQVLDLHLMLVGPRGSEPIKNWQSLVLFVERDDRVARKLAWLRPEDEQRDDDSFADFLKRTFLARPWSQDQTALEQNQSLDLVDPTTVGLPRSTAESFDRIALAADDDTSADEIVDQLVRAWQRRE